jgi:hypothetical protein
MNRLTFRRALRRELPRVTRPLITFSMQAPSIQPAVFIPLSDVAQPGAEQSPVPVADAEGEPDTERAALDPAPKEFTRSGNAQPVAAPAGRPQDIKHSENPPAPDPVNPHRAMALARLAKAKMQQPQPAIDRSRLPIATSREGCGRCGVRGDLGCAHQRAFEG